MKHVTTSNWLLALVLTGALTTAQTVQAQGAADYEFSFRPDVSVSYGKPANDMPAFSLIGRYRINSDWLIGAALEHSPLFDVETPYEWIDLNSPVESDAEASSTMLSVWAERRYGEESGGAYWYWTAGIGINAVDVDDLQGETKDGTPWDITIDADNETVVTLTLGRRHVLGNRRWLLGYGARVEERFAEWDMRDRVSGETSEINNYNVYGVFGDVTYRF